VRSAAVHVHPLIGNFAATQAQTFGKEQIL
jgi:hypothetical protein